MTSENRRKYQDLVSPRAKNIPQSKTVAIADLAARLRREGASVVDFSAGRAAEATATVVCDAAKEALSRGDTHQTEARGRPSYLEACAEKLKRENGLDLDPSKNVIATLGCKNGLLLSSTASLSPGDEILTEDPCFVSYGPEITVAGGVSVKVPLRPENGNRWSRKDLESAVTPKTRAILFCSPHNPVGVVHTAEDLQVIADVAQKHDLVVIADEIYEAVTWGGRKHLPIAALPGMADRTIGLMGLTKSYSMGGWRIGYAYASEPLIAAMTKVQQHCMTCASSFAQMGALKALSDEVTRSMKELWLDWEKRCEYATSTLDAVDGLSVAMPEGAFYAWIDISDLGLASQKFAEKLLTEKKVALVPGGAFGQTTDHFVRVTCVRSWEELKDGVERIVEFVESL
jgi:aspartate aminotransferase